MSDESRWLTWPRDPISELPVGWLPVVGERDGWIHFEPSGEPIGNRLPVDFSIRELLALDPHEAEQIVGFVSNWGLVSGSTRIMRGPTTKANRSLPSAHLSGDRPGSSIHVTEVFADLTVARAASLHVLSLLAEVGDRVEAWCSAGFDVHEERQADELLIEALQTGLRAYAPRLEFHRTRAFPGKAFGAAKNSTDWTQSFGDPNPDLYSGICLQLFNLLAEGLPATRCKDDRCNGWFVRQRGRSEYGQYRTSGVTYCSTACARAHTQRIRRQKARAAKIQPGHHAE